MGSWGTIACEYTRKIRKKVDTNVMLVKFELRLNVTHKKQKVVLTCGKLTANCADNIKLRHKILKRCMGPILKRQVVN